MGLLEGKKAVILGAASKDNIGQATARLFAAEGAEVVVAGRKEGPLTELAAEIGGHVGLCDITSHKEVHGLAKLAAEKWVELMLLLTAVAGVFWPTYWKTQKSS